MGINDFTSLNLPKLLSTSLNPFNRPPAPQPSAGKFNPFNNLVISPQTPIFASET